MKWSISSVKMPLLLAVAAALVLLACAPAAVPGGGAKTLPAPAPPGAFARGEPGPAGAPSLSKDAVVFNEATSVERRIIRNVQMTVVVQKIQEALDKISAIAGKYDGFVVSAYRQGEDETSSASITRGEASSASITIRVASDKVDDALKEVRGIAVRVPSESSKSQDVTEEFMDMEARLKNLDATEKQFLEIMKKAEKVEDILKVQAELSRVRGEIEQVKGRLQYLERTTATSLISITLMPAISPEPLVRPGWDPLETIKAAFRDFAKTAQGLADAAIWIAVYAPVWGVLVIIGVAVWRLSRRWRTGRK